MGAFLNFLGSQGLGLVGAHQRQALTVVVASLAQRVEGCLEGRARGCDVIEDQDSRINIDRASGVDDKRAPQIILSIFAVQSLLRRGVSRFKQEFWSRFQLRLRPI